MPAPRTDILFQKTVEERERKARGVEKQAQIADYNLTSMTPP